MAAAGWSADRRWRGGGGGGGAAAAGGTDTARAQSGSHGPDELAEISREVAILKKISSHPYFVRLVEFLNNDQADLVYMGQQRRRPAGR